MAYQEITQDNIKSFLKTRKDNKFYFKFPWLKGKKTLICEIEGVIQYWPNFKWAEVKEDILRKAFKSYQKRIRNEKV